MISIESLSKKYGNNQVLADINLKLERGEIHGIVGKNGAGKTTLFRCLLGLEKFDGKISESFNQPLKNVTGFLQTTPAIISRVTAKEYLQLLCEARQVAFDRQEIENENLFDLPLNEYMETFSTGMLKKLALHGLLLQKNEVFILDEPFNGLDYQSCLLVIALLAKMKESGKTVVISSHIFSTLSDTCDYIHHLDDGMVARTAAKGTFKEIEQVLQKELIGSKIDNLNL